MLDQDRVEMIIKRLTALIRIVLFICIALSTFGLISVIIKGGQFDWGSGTFTYLDGIAIITVFAAFYSIIYGTIPALFILIAIKLDNKFRRKTTTQEIRTETRLLLLNFATLLLAATILTIKYFQTVKSPTNL